MKKLKQWLSLFDTWLDRYLIRPVTAPSPEPSIQLPDYPKPVYYPSTYGEVRLYNGKVYMRRTKHYNGKFFLGEDHLWYLDENARGAAYYPIEVAIPVGGGFKLSETTSHYWQLP